MNILCQFPKLRDRRGRGRPREQNVSTRHIRYQLEYTTRVCVRTRGRRQTRGRRRIRHESFVELVNLLQTSRAVVPKTLACIHREKPSLILTSCSKKGVRPQFDSAVLLLSLLPLIESISVAGCKKQSTIPRPNFSKLG